MDSSNSRNRINGYSDSARELALVLGRRHISLRTLHENHISELVEKVIEKVRPRLQYVSGFKPLSSALDSAGSRRKLVPYTLPQGITLKTPVLGDGGGLVIDQVDKEKWKPGLPTHSVVGVVVDKTAAPYLLRSYHVLVDGNATPARQEVTCLSLRGPDFSAHEGYLAWELIHTLSSAFEESVEKRQKWLDECEQAERYLSGIKNLIVP